MDLRSRRGRPNAHFKLACAREGCRRQDDKRNNLKHVYTRMLLSPDEDRKARRVLSPQELRWLKRHVREAKLVDKTVVRVCRVAAHAQDKHQIVGIGDQPLG